MLDGKNSSRTNSYNILGNPNETEAKSQEQPTTISNPISRSNMSYTGAPYSNSNFS